MPKKKTTTTTTKKKHDVAERVKQVSALVSALVVIFTTVGSILNWFEGKVTEHIDNRIDTLEATVNNIRQDTVRLQLGNLIDSDSDNIESILTVAKVYFIDMNGDWYMTEKFKRWGREHDVDLSDFNFASHPHQLAE